MVKAKAKNGYVLATTLVMMIVIFALSSVVLAMVQSVSITKSRVENGFNQSVAIRQIASDYVYLAAEEFEQKQSESCQIATLSGVKVFTNTGAELVYKIEQSGTQTTFTIFTQSKNEKVAEVVKVVGQVTLWKYYY